METKHLAPQSAAVEPVRLALENPQTLEVPAGESRYLLYQTDGSAAVTLHLRHPGSRTQIIGLVEAAGESTPLLRIEVLHHAPDTQAETLVRTLANNSAQPRFEGLIHMDPAAQGSESYLNHHSLLLGDTAKSWTLPSLEILANQVKCSHAATIRTIGELELFYPRSRGIAPADAKTMLIEAFLTDVAQCRATGAY